jgi:hypothetical protein
VRKQKTKARKRTTVRKRTKARADTDEIAACFKKLSMERATDACNKAMDGLSKPAVMKGSLVLPLGLKSCIYIHTVERQ